jgi:hypothetical protein
MPKKPFRLGYTSHSKTQQEKNVYEWDRTQNVSATTHLLCMIKPNRVENAIANHSSLYSRGPRKWACGGYQEERNLSSVNGNACVSASIAMTGMTQTLLNATRANAFHLYLMGVACAVINRGKII